MNRRCELKRETLQTKKIDLQTMLLVPGDVMTIIDVIVPVSLMSDFSCAA